MADRSLIKVASTVPTSCPWGILSPWAQWDLGLASNQQPINGDGGPMMQDTRLSYKDYHGCYTDSLPSLLALRKSTRVLCWGLHVRWNWVASRRWGQPLADNQETEALSATTTRNWTQSISEWEGLGGDGTLDETTALANTLTAALLSQVVVSHLPLW